MNNKILILFILIISVVISGVLWKFYKDEQNKCEDVDCINYLNKKIYIAKIWFIISLFVVVIAIFLISVRSPRSRSRSPRSRSPSPRSRSPSPPRSRPPSPFNWYGIV